MAMSSEGIGKLIAVVMEEGVSEGRCGGAEKKCSDPRCPSRRAGREWLREQHQ